MASSIDTTGLDETQPPEGQASTAAVRSNFSDIKTNLETAKSEITALQTVDTDHAAATTAHGTTGDIVGTSDTQTLSGKTITAAANTLDATVEDIAGLTPAVGKMILGDGSNFVSQNHIIRENFIIGGDLATNGTNPYQRGTSGTAATTDYMADRFKTLDDITFATEPTWAQTVDGLTITSNEATTHSTYAFYSHMIEGYETTRLFSSSDYFVLQGSIKSSVTGKVYVSVRSAPADASYVFPVNVSAGVATAFSEVIPVPVIGTYGVGTAAGFSVTISRSNNNATFQTATFNAWHAGNYLSGADQLDLHATSGATISIDKLKIEPGAIATPFWTPDFGKELRRCKRYFKILPALQGAMNEANTQAVFATIGVEGMRSSPAYSIWTSSGRVARPGIAFYDISSLGTANDDYITIVPSTLPGASKSLSLRNNAIAADAEL